MNNLTRQAFSAATGILAPKYQTPPDYDFWRTKEQVSVKEAVLLAAGINPKHGCDVGEYWGYLSSRQQASFTKAETAFKEFDGAVKHGAEWLALAIERGLLPNDLQTDQQTFAEYQAAKLVREIIGRNTSPPWTEMLLARIERIAEKDGHAAALQDLWRALSGHEERDGEPEQKCFRWLRGELGKRPAIETLDSKSSQGMTLGQWLDKQVPNNTGKSEAELSIVQGVSKAEILAIDWPLSSRCKLGVKSLERALGDVPQWLDAARVGPRGAAGIDSHRWNPAMLAFCLCSHGWIANKERLQIVLENHFKEWLPKWEDLEKELKSIPAWCSGINSGKAR